MTLLRRHFLECRLLMRLLRHSRSLRRLPMATRALVNTSSRETVGSRLKPLEKNYMIMNCEYHIIRVKYHPDPERKPIFMFPRRFDIFLVCCFHSTTIFIKLSPASSIQANKIRRSSHPGFCIKYKHIAVSVLPTSLRCSGPTSQSGSYCLASSISNVISTNWTLCSNNNIPLTRSIALFNREAK